MPAPTKNRQPLSQGPAPTKYSDNPGPPSPGQVPMMSSDEASGRDIDVANLCHFGCASRMAASNRRARLAADGISKGSPWLHGHGHCSRASSHSSRLKPNQNPSQPCPVQCYDRQCAQPRWPSDVCIGHDMAANGFDWAFDLLECELPLQECPCPCSPGDPLEIRLAAGHP